MLHAAHNLREWCDRNYLKLTFFKQNTVYFKTSNTLCKQNVKWRVVMCLQIGQTNEKAVIILIQTKLLVKRPSLFNGCLTLKGPLTHLIVDLFFFFSVISLEVCLVATNTEQCKGIKI